MIKEIKITNFYSFSEETIVLQPDTNILIGINGSGKSNFFKAVRLLKEGVAGIGLKKYIIDTLGGFDNIYFKGTKDSTAQRDKISIEYHFRASDLTEFGYNLKEDIVYTIYIFRNRSSNNFYVGEVALNPRGILYLQSDNGIGLINKQDNKNQPNYQNSFAHFDGYNQEELALSKIGPDIENTEVVLSTVFDREKYPVLSSIRKAISDIVIYDFFDTTFRSQIRKPILSTSERKLLPDGSNLTQILNTIKINHKQAYDKIVRMLAEVNSNFKGFDFNFIGGNIELMLDEKGLGSAVHVSSISDGTLRYLCLLAILYNPERGNFICIDEPEVGLHPDMILNISNAMKEASERSTLIISTHSITLLDYFNIAHLRVFEKDENNTTKVITFKEEQFEGWYEEFSVGKMWVAGDFGGVRYGG
jgi:predicted ATPase